MLLANAHEWSSRSLESFLVPNGYAVVRAYTAASALQRGRTMPIDAAILDVDLPDLGAFAVCRAMRADPHLPASLPIVLVAGSPGTRAQRLEALQAGANDFWSQPLDPEELLLRLSAHIRAKRDADRAREEGLVDPATGLYNGRGLYLRAQDLQSQAARAQGPLACVVFGLRSEAAQERGTPPWPSAAPTAEDPVAAARTIIDVLTRALRDSGRASDAIGRLGPLEFAVLAPHTDAAGAVRLAIRLAEAVKRTATQRQRALGGPLSLRAGYHAISGGKTASAKPADLVASARTALRSAQASADGEGGEGEGTESWIRAFKSA